jgi:hypothetical protein
MGARDPDELILEFLEPFVRGHHGLDVRLEDPAMVRPSTVCTP